MCDIYIQASRIVENIINKKGSTKSLTFGNSNIQNKRVVYAIACETLKYRDIIEKLLNKVFNTSDLTHFKTTMLYVMVYDLLISDKKRIQGGGKVKKFLINKEQLLRASLESMMEERGFTTTSSLLPKNIRDQEQLPRYVRVNTIKLSTDRAKEIFISEGYNVLVDEHVTDLLVLPPNTDIHSHPLVLSREVILQDKASCFPAFVLSPPQNSTVIDTCAAPGNKTSHLSALMNNTGCIYAFERNKSRYDLLSKFMNLSGCTNVKAINKDFLTSDPFSEEFSKVEYLLVDPSCSGSGIVSRIGEVSENQSRLEGLAKFQIEVLSHSMKFPSAKVIVYSTCSIHREENEDVVQTVLLRNNCWKLRKDILPNWKRRGLDCFKDSQELIRADPKQDRTQGFFVACFEKVANQELSLSTDIVPRVASPKFIPQTNLGHKKRVRSDQDINVAERKKKKHRKKKPIKL